MPKFNLFFLVLTKNRSLNINNDHYQFNVMKCPAVLPSLSTYHHLLVLCRGNSTLPVLYLCPRQSPFRSHGEHKIKSNGVR